MYFMKSLSVLCALSVFTATVFIPVHPAYALESREISSEEGSSEEASDVISASEEAVMDLIRSEKSSIEAAHNAIDEASELNRFTYDRVIAERILAEKASIKAARENLERAAEINKQKEYADIIESMPDHTYIDIDLTKQTLTYYINGGVTMVSDIVSGNVSRRCDTPQGVYQIYGKQKGRTLRGPNYEAFVNYWMPFTGNYGIHDATWRSSFGGDIYRTNGSHGCVNISKSTAAILYETAPVGTKVFVHL